MAPAPNAAILYSLLADKTAKGSADMEQEPANGAASLTREGTGPPREIEA